jgi:hypothetical protein
VITYLCRIIAKVPWYGIKQKEEVEILILSDFSFLGGDLFVTCE